VRTRAISFFFSFFHAFIVSRYKKLRAALAMERTKAINQNKKQKKPYFPSTALAVNTWGRNRLPIIPYGIKIQGNYNTRTTSRICALWRGGLCKEKFNN